MLRSRTHKVMASAARWPAKTGSSETHAADHDARYANIRAFLADLNQRLDKAHAQIDDVLYRLK